MNTHFARSDWLLKLGISTRYLLVCRTQWTRARVLITFPGEFGAHKIYFLSLAIHWFALRTKTIIHLGVDEYQWMFTVLWRVFIFKTHPFNSLLCFDQRKFLSSATLVAFTGLIFTKTIIHFSVGVWTAVDIYRATKKLSKYPPLFTSSLVNYC